MSDITKFVNEHADLEFIKDNTKVRVISTRHEMPASIDIINQYINSKKYTMYKDSITYDFAQHEPLIVAHKSLPNKLYSVLTNHVLNRVPAEVQKEVSGRKFLRLKALYDADLKEEKEKREAEEARKKAYFERKAAMKARAENAEVGMDDDLVVARMEELEAKVENDTFKKELLELGVDENDIEEIEESEDEDLSGETVDIAVLKRLQAKQAAAAASKKKNNQEESEDEDEDDEEEEEQPKKKVAAKGGLKMKNKSDEKPDALKKVVQAKKPTKGVPSEAAKKATGKAAPPALKKGGKPNKK